MDQQKSKEIEFKSLIELASAFAKYGTLGVGGFCLLAYSNEIGQFPEGMGLGEGLAFYLVCAGFLIVYAIYTVICTAMGSFLLAWPARWLNGLILRRASLAKKPIGRMLLYTEFSSMREIPVIALGIIGLLGHVIYIYSNAHPAEAAMSLMVPLAQGIGVFLLLVVTRRHQHLQSGLLLQDDNPKALAVTRKEIVSVRRVFFIWLVVAPLALAPDRLFLVNAAFRLAQLRKDAATVHIKTPWSIRVGQSTLTKGPSFLGNDYVEFKKVNVLLRSVGQKVVVEVPDNSGVTRLPIPSDSIYVE